MQELTAIVQQTLPWWGKRLRRPSWSVMQAPARSGIRCYTAAVSSCFPTTYRLGVRRHRYAVSIQTPCHIDSPDNVFVFDVQRTVVTVRLPQNGECDSSGLEWTSCNSVRMLGDTRTAQGCPLRVSTVPLSDCSLVLDAFSVGSISTVIRNLTMITQRLLQRKLLRRL